MTDTAGKGPGAPGDPNHPRASRPGATAHRERLYVTWYLWPLPLLAATLLAAEIHLGYPGVRAWLPYLLLIPLTVLIILRLGWTQVRVDDGPDGELRVGEARLPLRFVGEVEIIDAKDKRRVLGPNLNPAAFLIHRGWVRPLVRVTLTDPDDPTPYWLFSTRHPHRVAELLRGRR